MVSLLWKSKRDPLGPNFLLLLLLLLTLAGTKGDSGSSSLECLPTCECNYAESSQTLEINCINQLWPGRGQLAARVNLTASVRTLVLKNIVLHNAEALHQSIPIPLKSNTVVNLELRNVTLHPIVFLNSAWFTNQKSSLRNLSFYQVSSTAKETIEARSYRDDVVPYASLEVLESLTICDSSQYLSQVALQAVPKLANIKVVNSSLQEIFYYSFSHLEDLKTLNLSHNKFQTLSTGLLSNLRHLQSLDLSNNRLRHIQEDLFSGLASLRKLDLRKNHIEYVDAEVFTQLRDLREIDMSDNEVIQFFEPYFKHNMLLRYINMSNAWVRDTFVNENAARAYREMEGLITTLQAAEVLDLSHNQMTVIPETLSHVPSLKEVYLNDNPWSCSCKDRWLLGWLTTSNANIKKRQAFCHEKTERYPIAEFLGFVSNCKVLAKYPFKYYAAMGDEKTMGCHPTASLNLTVTWITPSKDIITRGSDSGGNESQHSFDNDGGLVIHNVRAGDYGLYLCIATYKELNLNITHYVHLGMDVSNFEDVKLMSIVCGLITSFGFLFIVLLAQFIKWILIKSGLACIAVRTANQARKVRAFLISMEQNKSSQLEWLRQNYNMQTKKIQENCICQLERIRESYTNQTKNLSEFRDYSTQQLTQMRDQYQDQIRKVASYSARRLGKVRENYVFNRNRVGKFSSHQFIRLREAYKWQAQTLSKILENLPQGLNLDSCRGVGVCGRTESIYLDENEEILGVAHLANLRSTLGLPEDFSSQDKHEHISLLIPREFMATFSVHPVPHHSKDVNHQWGTVEFKQNSHNDEEKSSFYDQDKIPFVDEHV